MAGKGASGGLKGVGPSSLTCPKFQSFGLKREACLKKTVGVAFWHIDQIHRKITLFLRKSYWQKVCQPGWIGAKTIWTVKTTVPQLSMSPFTMSSSEAVKEEYPRGQKLEPGETTAWEPLPGGRARTWSRNIPYWKGKEIWQRFPRSTLALRTGTAFCSPWNEG